MLDLNDVLTFGQFKGKKIREIIDANPGYINWLRGERQSKNRENFLTPAADVYLMKAGSKGYKISPRLTEAEMKDEAGTEALRKAFATKEENERREADANRTREEVYGSEWGGW